MAKVHPIVDRHPLVVGASLTIGGVLNRMIKDKKGCAIVADRDGNLIGMITERDVLRKLSRSQVQDRLSKGVRAVMTPNLIGVPHGDLLHGIQALHKEHGFRHFPVYVEGDSNHIDNLVGVVTVSTFFQYYIDHMVAWEDAAG